MSADPRIEVAAEALRHPASWHSAGDVCSWCQIGVYAMARAVVAALDAHDAGLRERLAQAVEAACRCYTRTGRAACLVCTNAARTVRDTP